MILLGRVLCLKLKDLVDLNVKAVCEHVVNELRHIWQVNMKLFQLEEARAVC